MIRKYALFSSASCLLLSALAIISGCGQPAAAPAKTEGLAPVPPQPSATPQPASAEPVPSEPAALAIPAPKAPKPPAESTATAPKEPAAAVAVPLTDTAASPTTDAANLIPEGAWEEGYPSWQPRGKVKITTDDEEKQEGVRSLRFDLKGNSGFELVRWEVGKGEIKPGDKYLLKGYVKTKDIQKDAAVQLTAFAIDSKSGAITWFKSAPFGGTTSWTQVEVPFEIPGGADALAVRIEYSQKSKKAATAGTAWVDAMSISAVSGTSDAPKNLVANGDFEAFTNFWQDLPDAAKLASDTAEKDVKGNASIRIDLTGLSKANLMQWISGVEPNSVYRLDGHMKLNDVNGYAFLSVVAENSKRQNKAWLSTEKLAGTTNWQEVSLQFKTAADTDTLGVRFEFQPKTPGTVAGGTIWIDNITLAKIE